MMMTDEEKMKAGVGNAGTANNQAPSDGTLSAQDKAAIADMQAKQQELADRSAVARFNEEPFIVAVKALLLKIDLEPKIGWEVEWQAVRRELKALEESMQ